MKVITCISFHGTGSGAVDDFLKEFDNCVSARSNIESRFLQDPDGVSDLEYNLVDNPNRLNSGYAIKRFKQFAKDYNHTYKIIFGEKWLEYSNKYADSLVTAKYPGYWHGDLVLLKPLTRYIYLGRRVFNKCLPKKFRKPRYYNYFPNMDYYHSYLTREEFLEKTQDYVENLCGLINPENREFVILDQFVATSNIARYIPYVKDLKVIVVDRDPRDLYINQMRNGDHVLPRDPKVFAKVYRDQRRMIGTISEDLPVLQLKFEDMIYDYDNTTKKVIAFVGEDESHHINPRKVFIPEVSKKNTRMWLTYPEYKDAAEYLAEELKEFTYDYSGKIL